MKAQQKILILGGLIFIFSMTLALCSHSENMKRLDVQIQEIRVSEKSVSVPAKTLDPFLDVEPPRKKWLW